MSRRAIGRPAVVAFTVGVTAFACGAGPSRLSASEYRARASAQCERLRAASDELRKAQEPSAVGPTVARFLHGAADRLRKLVRELGELEPPRALEHDADQLVGLLDDYSDGLDRLGDGVAPSDDLTATFERHQRLVQRMNGAAADATELVTRLELTDCILS